MQKHVLLIDDIFTTGATARAAAKTLMEAGAASVWVATLARAGWVRDSRRGSSVRLNDAEEIALSHPRSPQRAEIARRGPRYRNNKDAAMVRHPEILQGANIDSSHEQSSF
jgi:predicted phosphoribosyltransferase